MTDSAKILDALRDLLRRQSDIGVAIVFGSLASGTAGRDSDLDLAVGSAAPGATLSPNRRIELIDALGRLTGRPVDLVDLASVGEPLLGQILADGRMLVGTTVDKARLINRHLLDREDFLPYRNRILEQRQRHWIGN